MAEAEPFRVCVCDVSGSIRKCGGYWRKHTRSGLYRSPHQGAVTEDPTGQHCLHTHSHTPATLHPPMSLTEMPAVLMVLSSLLLLSPEYASEADSQQHDCGA